MSEPLRSGPIRVEVEGLETPLEFPQGTDQSVIQSTVKRLLSENVRQQEPDIPRKRTPPRTSGFLPEPTDDPSPGTRFDLPFEEKARLLGTSFLENLGEQFDPRQLTPEDLGDLGIMGGATVGARMGSKLGPTGMATGGILGAAAAASGKAAVEDKPLKEGATDIAREAALEAGGFGAARIFDGQLISKGLSKLFGVSDEQAKMTSSAARRQGIDLGITDVGNQAARGAKTVLGVFPFVSEPFRKSTKKQQEQALSVLTEKLNNIAPNSKLTELGVDMVKAAKNSFDEFRTVASTLYTQADDLAEDLPVKDIVPTSPLKQTIKNLVSERGRPITQSGKAVRGPSNTELDGFMEDLEDLPENISVTELRAIQQDIGEFFSQSGAKGYDTRRLAQLKSATEDAMFNLDTSRLDPQQAEAVQDAYKTANNFYFENMKRFETSTARKFGRVDKNIFKAGKETPGYTNQDEVVGQVFNSKSPQALRDLKNLVGEKEFLKASRRHLDSVFKTSFDKESGQLVFNPTQIKQRLGFSGVNEDSALDSLKVMLEGTKQNADDLKEFLDVAENVGNIVVPATMVKRRFILGGIKSALRTFTMGSLGAAGTAAAPQSLGLTIPIIYMVRRGSKFLTDPNSLRDMTRLMKSTTLDEESRAAALRLLRFAVQEEPGERAQKIEAPAL